MMPEHTSTTGLVISLGAVIAYSSIVFSAGVFFARNQVDLELTKLEGQIQLLTVTLQAHATGPPHEGVQDALQNIALRLTLIEQAVDVER